MNDTSMPLPPGFTALDLTLGIDRLSLMRGGSGRPLVLLHSLLADRTSFEHVIGPLARSHEVIALDLPGFGASDFVDGGLDQVADRVAQGIEALALPDKPVLLGNGYGGFVALLTAIRHPALADRLVLADCGAAFSDAGRSAFLGMAAAAETSGLATVADVAMRRLFAPEYQAAHPELITHRKQRFLALDPRTFRRACLNLASLDLRPQLAAVDAPALVLVGEADEATPPAMSHELASGLPRAQLKVLAGCAHVPQLQAPELFLDAIHEFIAGTTLVEAV